MIRTRKGIKKIIIPVSRRRGDREGGSGTCTIGAERDISWEIIGTDFTEPFWTFLLCLTGILFERLVLRIAKIY